MKSLSLERKLLANIGVMLLLLLGLALFSMQTIQSLGTRLDEGLNVSARKLDLFNAVRARMQEMIANARAVQLAASAKDPAAVAEFKKRFEAAAKRAKEMSEDLRPTLRTADELSMMSLLDTNLAELRALASSSFASAEPDPAAQLKLTQRISKQVDGFEKASVAFSRSQRALLAESGKVAKQDVQRSEFSSYAFVGAISLLALLVTITIHRAGISLTQIATALKNSAAEVNDAAHNIAASSNQVARGASEQAACVEETSASTKQLSAIIMENSNQAKTSAATVAQTESTVTSALATVKEMTESMAELQAATARITGITSVIETIAFQTNILALNAAVEASRAGEAGAGFAVVADEVRNLAHRSSDAARDITTLVSDSLAKSKVHAQRFADLSHTMEAFADVSASAQKLVEKVATASHQQEAGVTQILKAMQQIEDIVQTNAASAEESASISEEMAAKAETLDQLGVKLSGIINGVA